MLVHNFSFREFSSEATQFPEESGRACEEDSGDLRATRRTEPHGAGPAPRGGYRGRLRAGPRDVPATEPRHERLFLYVLIAGIEQHY